MGINYRKVLEFYRNKRVLITGNTGFKGSWMTYILLRAGAEVIGYSLYPPTKPALFDLLGLEGSKGLQQYYGHESEEAADGLNLVARLFRWKGDWAHALEYYQQALDIYEKLPDDPERDLNLWREVIDQLKEKIRQEKRP